MKSFKEYLNESRTDTSARAIEQKLRKLGYGYKIKKNINDTVFQMDGGYKIVTDGNVFDLKKGKKTIDTFPNARGMSDRVIKAYEDEMDIV